jgi:hypothetical protein
MFGSMFGIGLFVVMLFSVPLNVIALMRFMGWEWWSALIAAVLLNAIPVVGQIAYVVFAFLGAYFLVSAGFDWHAAIYPAPRVVSAAEMSTADFEQYRRVVEPEIARACKEEGKKQYAMPSGAVPVAVSTYCDCYARVIVRTTTQSDMAYLEKTGSRPADLDGRVKAAISRECRS